MSTAYWITGETRATVEKLATEGVQVDLVLTSPPFLALRSYLPDDHPDKAAEIGSEATPAAFVDTLLELTAGWRSILAPHGSIAVELGDTYAGSGGAGGDYDDGLRAGQPKFRQPTSRYRGEGADGKVRQGGDGLGDVMVPLNGGPGWPDAKSLTMIPELYRASLAYGRNLLTGEQSPAGRWRVRNVVRWVRPNPPVGALCVDDQTEALTLDGWKRHDELHDGDLIATYDPKTDRCRFAPAKFVRWERENEPMVVIDKKATSQMLTEDHRCWTRTRKSAPHVALARDLTNDSETLLCAPFDDVPWPAPVTLERAALLGWFVAEGTPHGGVARIVQSETANPQKCERIRSLLDTDGADYRESLYVHPYNDSTIITFHVKGELAEWLNAHHKRLPMSYVTSWPEAHAQALFDALIDGDGHRRKNAEGITFHQQDEGVADAVQVLALRLGYRASKWWQPSSRGFQVTMSRSLVKDRRWTKIRKWEGEGIGRELYTGTVWCPMVETSFWLARRGGRTFITGNSDKFRPATSDMAIACVSRTRWFDLDAVRTKGETDRRQAAYEEADRKGAFHDHSNDGIGRQQGPKPFAGGVSNPAGAPPLDWWSISPGGYSGSHYAVFPPELCVRPIEAMCPRRVCRTCGEPSRRLVEKSPEYAEAMAAAAPGRAAVRNDVQAGQNYRQPRPDDADYTTTGWSSCDCPGCDGIRLDGFHTGTGWRPGLVLDPFGGSGTTGLVATGHGRDAILIDLDSRNVELAHERLGMFLSETTPTDLSAHLTPVPAFTAPCEAEA